jgi:GntR family transcriptional repressor for pyruvate dehydrogenase complex
MMLQRSNAEELYEFRVIFDIAALKLAITKATEDEKHIIRQKFHEYKTLSEAHIPAADQADQEFHKIILNATRNQFIIKMGTLVMELCRPYSKKGNDVLDKTVMDNHEKMMEIFCSGDTTDIEDVVRNSLIVFRHILDNGLHKDI